jgi:hypothetical protein
MIKRILVSYWLFIGFLRKHTKLLFVAIGVGLIAALILPKITVYLPKLKPHERIALIGRPTLSEIPLFIQQQISLGLTDVSKSGDTLPSIAVSYRVENEGKRFIFKLNPNLYWHDGKKFSAADVNYNFSDVEIIVNSPEEVAFELKEPFSPFPTIVSQPIFRQKKSRFLRRNTSLVGLGEMSVQSISRKGNYVSELVLVSSKVKRTYRFYNTQEAAILAFKLGEVDQILELSTPGELANWPHRSHSSQQVCSSLF